MNPWVAFWLFMACVALAIGYGSVNVPPTTRESVAIEMARQGKSPFVIQCILSPPVFQTAACDQAMREAVR